MGRSVILSLILLWNLCSDVYASEDQKYDHLEFYLHTVEVGDLVFNNFGHTAIRVVDKSVNRDYVFNWGIFDFKDPLSFSYQFYKGQLRYKLGVYSFRNSFRRYQLERRTVWQDKLLLNNRQKGILWKRLQWNIKPENAYYNYQYFFDNCSTRPRDYINEALAGRLQLNNSNISTHQSFRQMVLSHYETIPFIQVSLDILMNSRIDRVMSAWEKMFLPKSLRHYLLEYRDLEGRPVMVLDKTLVEFPKPGKPVLGGYQLVLVMTLPFIILVFFGLTKEGVGYQLTGRGYRCLGVVGLVFGIYTSLLGLLFPANWIFSAHFDLHHNANMWFFWPIDVVLVVIGLVHLLKGRRIMLRPMLSRLARIYCLTHICSAVIGSLMYLTGIIRQDLSLILIYILPISLTLFILTYQFGTGIKEK